MDRPREDTYILDPENVAEMARLAQQGNFVTEGMGGILPELENKLPARTKRVLDLGCGPGEWVMEVAGTFPRLQVVGLDISEIMVTYATAMAREKRLGNAHFVKANLLKPLPFVDNQFDIVNARGLGLVIKGDDWGAAAREWLRVTRPGGMLRSTELEDRVRSYPPATERLSQWLMQASRQHGYGFGPGTDSLNLMPTLGCLFKQVGWQELREHRFLVDISFGTPYYERVADNARIAYRQLWPVFQALGHSLKEIERTYNEMLAESPSPDFRSVCSFLVVSATKPEAPTSA